MVPDVEVGPELMPAIRSDRRGVARIEVGVARGEEAVGVGPMVPALGVDN